MPSEVLGVRESRRISPVAGTSLAGLLTVLPSLPMFLAGAMAVQMTADLGSRVTAIGLAVGAYRAGSVVTGFFWGRVVDQLGVRRSIFLVAGWAATGSLAIALTAQSLITLVAWMVFTGMSLAIAQPAANRLLSKSVAPDRLAIAFGIKQSAPPASSMLAGLAVPAVALTIGWRWAYVVVALGAVSLALMAAAMMPSQRPAARGIDIAPRMRLEEPGVILLLGSAFALASAVSSATIAFFVASADAVGGSPQAAATILAVASVAAILIRLLAGAISDRLRRGHLVLCAALLVIGAFGLALLATGIVRVMMVGVVLALLGCWGINGIFWYALIRWRASMPGRITGAVAPVGALGAMLGPVGFGFLVEAKGFMVAWVAALVIALLAAVLMVGASPRLASTSRLP